MLWLCSTIDDSCKDPITSFHLNPNTIRSAKLTSVSSDEQGCLLVPEFEVESEEGATFDYDLGSNSIQEKN